MASTVLVKDALWRVGVLLQDQDSQRWPERERVDWLNDAHVAVTKYLPPASALVISQRLRPGSLQSIDNIQASHYRLDGGVVPDQSLLGTTFLRPYCNMGSDGAVAGRAVRIVDGKVLDSQNPDWHSAVQAKTAVTSVVFDPLTPRHFHVFPPVHATTQVWMRIGLNAQPRKIPNAGTPEAPLYAVDGSNTTTISISDEYLDELVNYVVARAHMKDVEWADAGKAQAYTAMFVNSINMRSMQLLGVNPNLKLLPFAAQPIGAAG